MGPVIILLRGAGSKVINVDVDYRRMLIKCARRYLVTPTIQGRKRKPFVTGRQGSPREVYPVSSSRDADAQRWQPPHNISMCRDYPCWNKTRNAGTQFKKKIKEEPHLGGWASTSRGHGAGSGRHDRSADRRPRKRVSPCHGAEPIAKPVCTSAMDSSMGPLGDARAPPGEPWVCTNAVRSVLRPTSECEACTKSSTTRRLRCE